MVLSSGMHGHVHLFQYVVVIKVMYKELKFYTNDPILTDVMIHILNYTQEFMKVKLCTSQ